jgi:tetratricopeptide (TPR) repeat protein
MDRTLTLSSTTPLPSSREQAATKQEPFEDQRGTRRQDGQSVLLGSIATDRESLLHGQRAFDRGHDQAAFESLTRLVSRGVRYADVHYMLGILGERRGDLEGAIAQLSEATRINPSYVEALLALASLLERRGDFDQSQGYAERASQLSRPNGGGLDRTTQGKLANQQAELADALADAGEQRHAIEQYRGALERCPTFHDIRHRLGLALRAAGLPAQAAQEFQQILRLHPGMLESHVQLGLTYYSIGRTPDAVREWEAVLEREPGREDAQMYLRLVSGAPRREEEGSARPIPSEDRGAEISFQPISPKAPAAPQTAWKKTHLKTSSTP